MHQVPTKIIPELAINSLEEYAHQVIMVLPEGEQFTLAQIVTRLEGLFGENILVIELRF